MHDSHIAALPSCPIMPIDGALRRIGFDMSTDRTPCLVEARYTADDLGVEDLTAGLAVVRDGLMRGVVSHATLDELDSPLVVQWARDEGELLRLYQRAMKRCGFERSANVFALMGEMQ